MGQRLNFGVGNARIPMNQTVLREWHFVGFGLLRDLCRVGLLLLRGIAVPVGEIHGLASCNDVALHQPRDGGEAAIEGGACLVGMAVRTLVNQDSAHAGQDRAHAGLWLSIIQDWRVRRLRRVQARIPKGVNTGQRERGHEGNCDVDRCGAETAHDICSSEESTMARWECLAMYRTSVIPKTLFSLPAGTTMGPACGAEPGAG